MRAKNSRTGSALIEFAAALILLSGMFTGIFQVGYTFFLQHAGERGAGWGALCVIAGSELERRRSRVFEVGSEYGCLRRPEACDGREAGGARARAGQRGTGSWTNDGHRERAWF